MPDKPTRVIAEGKHIRLVARGKWEFAERKKVSGIVGIVAVTNQNKLILIEQFRRRLTEVRESCKNRPIIFIGHDFGVTIIEKTLMECAKDPSLVVDICKVTIGLLFFMTPAEKTPKEEQEVPYFDPRVPRLAAA